MATYQVHMLAFMDGNAIRNVEVPDEIISACGHDSETLLDKVFIFGQNDKQPIEKVCSVSAGDVIQNGERYFLILSTGFQEISEEQLHKYRSIERRDRFLVYFDRTTVIDKLGQVA